MLKTEITMFTQLFRNFTQHSRLEEKLKALQIVNVTINENAAVESGQDYFESEMTGSLYLPNSLNLICRQYLSRYLSESNTITIIRIGITGHNNCISVLQEFALFAVRELQRPGPFPGEFQHTAI